MRNKKAYENRLRRRERRVGETVLVLVLFLLFAFFVGVWVAEEIKRTPVVFWSVSAGRAIAAERGGREVPLESVEDGAYEIVYVP